MDVQRLVAEASEQIKKQSEGRKEEQKRALDAQAEETVSSSTPVNGKRTI